ncbi:MAG: 2'-deoxycytidine 5'-triphosphate deaminase [Alphaproteobacteria bacterium]|nr:2'-deoxycytidine 5'-triphosphate deaminase [Alphaproteobacteria bacterium]
MTLLDVIETANTGIWPAQRIKAAIERSEIFSESGIPDAQIQPASLDLRLGGSAYRVPASFLPGKDWTVRDKLLEIASEKIDLSGGAQLEKGNVYVIPLQEMLRLKKRVSGSANPKSSTGRLDIFARVITDYGTEFDSVAPNYHGPLWLEVAPRSFNVVARTGSKLAQLRIRTGSPKRSDNAIRELVENQSILIAEHQEPDIKAGKLALSVDVHGDPLSGLVGYSAKRTDAPVDVDKINFYEPAEFWDPVHRPKRGGLILNTSDFYILASKERVVIPPDYAADMVAYDTLVGEFRVHYAGFFDPGFGYTGSKPTGAKIVLEVRSHEVPFMIEDNQIVGRVIFEKLRQHTDRPYGSGIGSNYQGQALALSKQFRR